MMHKILCLLLIFSLIPVASAMPVSEWSKEVHYRNVTIFAPAVTETSDGYKGVLTQINATMQNGSGNVYVITSPLTEVDMQGSARLAVDVASKLVKRDGIDASQYDFSFVINARSSIVGGASAGGAMAVASISLLEGWNISNDVVMTGMINPDGSIGPVGGVLEKGEAAAEAGATFFLIPKGQGIVYRTITETKNIGGFIQIVQRKVPINVSDYLGNNYGIKVVEVEDINAAIHYFTGHTFPEEKSSQPITTEDYESIMGPLSMRLINEANESYKKAEMLLQNTSLPTGFWYDNPKARVEGSLNSALNSLKAARLAYNNFYFYYSISKSFQSLINSRFVTYICGYYNDGDHYYDSIHQNVLDMVNNALDKAGNAEINGMIALQCVGTAQMRALDAAQSMNNSEQYWNSILKRRDTDSLLSAFYQMAYAAERSKTVNWWLSLSEQFNETGSVNQSWLREMASKYYGYASQINAYASILISESGASTDFVNNAQNLLTNARGEMNDYPAASLFNSLESTANANIAIEAIDGVDEDKVGRTSEMASYSIQETRNGGIEPVLAVSYYEFGRSMEEQSLNNAVMYYKYSYMISNLLRLGLDYNGRVHSSYIGLPSPESDDNNAMYVFIAAGLFVMGAVVGGAITSVYGSKKRKEEISYTGINSLEEKQFECPICGKTFSSRQGMRIHLGKVHK
ncbi:MAG: S16 family serine protease [Candidatus Thermoplasmatota archaeon]|nr:S16 family serine protease [Candidatus Thermoplasmatota archaeon]